MKNVERYLLEKINEDGGILLNLIDPASQNPEDGAMMAKAAYEGGADVLLIGGSTSIYGRWLEDTIEGIKAKVDENDIPIIIFPGDVGYVSEKADAIYFMSMLNSRDPYYITGAHIKSSFFLYDLNRRFKVEILPVAYIVIEPGETVAWVGDAKIIPRAKPKLAQAAALAGQYLGMRFVITDSGSGASSPPPNEFFREVKSVLSIPYIYAGGIKNEEHAYNVIRSGADGIQVGTAIEGKSFDEIKSRIAKMSSAVKKAGREKKAQIR